MCNTQGPKYFFPPNQLNAGSVAPPVNYASNPQSTFDAGNPANFPAPAPPSAQPPASPVSNMMRYRMPGMPGGFGGVGNGGRFSGRQMLGF